MAQDDIQGQVVDAQGNPVDGAIVELTKSYQSSPLDEQVVRRTTTDANGNYIFEFHPDGDGTTQEWHVSCYNHDGTVYVNSFNNPGVTADLPSNAIPDSGISRYRFEQNANDAWGGNDGTVNGATFTTNNQEGTYAADFDGVDDTINIGAMGDLEALSELSIVGWIYIKSGMLDGGNYGVYWQSNGNFTSRLGVRFGTNGDILGFTPGNNGNDDYPPVGSSYTNLSTGTYYHFAGTFSQPNNRYTWYLNANQDGSSNSAPSDTPTSLSGNGVFGYTSDWGEYAGIYLDLVDFYSKELTQTEVENHMNTGSING